MKNLFLILTILLSTYTYSQKYTLLQINSEWNKANDVRLPEIPGVTNSFAYLEDQTPSFKQSVKSVPVVILFKDNTPIAQWAAGISMRLEIREEDVLEAMKQ